MSRRLEIELTSERPDGTWTWRAAGAKQPKGELDSTVLPQGVQVGDIVRADADFAVDGIEIIAVLPPKATRKEPERLVVVGTRTDEPLVTTQLAPKGRGRRDRDWDGGDRPDRGDRRDRRGGPRSERDGERPRRDRSDRPRGPRPDPVPERPRPKRLRPGRAHRAAILDELAPEERPIAEQVLRGGVPAVREAINKQNEQARAENRPEIPGDQLVALAEKLLPRLRAAEWRDKADAALADLDELDLRDLRSVVVAADGNTRDDEAKALLVQLQEGLARRVEQEQSNWIEDMNLNLEAGRFVRALRLSSRPPKAGTPLPPELATRLITAVSEGLTPTVNQDLWAAAVDALAFSPVRNKVVPAGRPEQPGEALIEAVTRVGDRLPAMVELFGLDPAEVAKAAKRRSRGGRPGAKGAGRQGSGKGATPEASDEDRTSSPTVAPNDPGASAAVTEGSLAQGPHATEDEAERDAVAVDQADSTQQAAPSEAPAPSEDAAPSEPAETGAELPTSDDLPTEAPEAGVEAERTGVAGGGSDDPVSEAATVTVDVQGDDGPPEVEVPAAAEQVVVERLSEDSVEPQ